jgi:serine/threonine protein kinase
VTDEDIVNERRAIEKLCMGKSHPNLIHVLQQGRLANSSYFFIDMELCDFNLEQYLLDKPIALFLRNGLGNTEILDIMTHLASGVEFIHSHGEVHRDLKPRNGMSRHCYSNVI